MSAYVVLLHECGDMVPTGGACFGFGSVSFARSGDADAFARWCKLFWLFDVSLVEVDEDTGEIMDCWELMF